MPSADGGTKQQVVVVTGGAAGIGAAIAEEFGRNGAFVVTLDPIMSLDGSKKIDATGPTTAQKIVEAGGSARASDASVTDGEAVRSLFTQLVEEFGALDAVVNVAGISRPTDFASGTEDDWAAVLGVHLDGYLNVLAAALPIMADAGRGRILGVTSGSGWRPANTGAYGCAKRAVASLTWQMGRAAPPGVTVNALSPIAATRMVTGALTAPAPTADRNTRTGGVNLGAMPPPEYLGPVGAYLAGEAFASWCRGQVIFSGGSDVAWVTPPHLLEVCRTADVTSLPHMLETVVPIVFAPAEAAQATNGGGNPRFSGAFDTPGGGSGASDRVRSCAIVSDNPGWQAAIGEALASRGVKSASVGAASGFAAAAAQLAAAAQGNEPFDGVVVALSGGAPSAADGWHQILDEHAGITEQIRTDAGWIQAATGSGAEAGRPMRVVTVTDATTAGGRSRGQAAAQLARAAHSATSERVDAFAISIESAGPAEQAPAAQLAAYLLCDENTSPFSGAEWVIGSGWLGLRSHPSPATTIGFGGPAIPDWLDGVLRGVVTGTD